MQIESHGISAEVDVKFACPKCQTRYACLTSEIQGLEPEFHCRKCETHFGFRFDPDLAFHVLSANQGGVTFECYVLEKAPSPTPAVSAAATAAAASASFISNTRAPTSAAANPWANARQGLDLLDQAWEDVKKNWGTHSFHRKFIDSAIQQKKISFAANRYQRVLEENPADEIAQKMRLDLIEEASLAIPTPTLKEAQTTARRSGVIFLTNLVAVLLIGLGVGLEEARQLIAVGASLFIVTFGFSKFYFNR